MFPLRALHLAEHSLHPCPPVTPCYHACLQESTLSFHERYVPHLESERLVSIFHFVPTGDGAGEHPLVSKGLGTVSVSGSPHQPWISNRHPGRQELQVQSPCLRAAQCAHPPDSFSSQSQEEGDS